MKFDSIMMRGEGGPPVTMDTGRSFFFFFANLHRGDVDIDVPQRSVCDHGGGAVSSVQASHDHDHDDAKSTPKEF